MKTTLRYLCWWFLALVLLAVIVGKAVEHGVWAVIFSVLFIAAVVGAVVL